MVKLTPQDYKIMPWKNGRGQTSEILIARPEEAFPHDFMWRISCATVDRSGPFSLYPGYDRWLAIWQGDGLIFNGARVDPFTVVRFAGELAIDCGPAGSSVKDLGLIYLRSEIDAKMTVVRLQPGEFIDLQNRASGGEVDVLFCASGDVHTSTSDFQFNLKVEDCLHWDCGQKVTLTVAPDVRKECILFHMQVRKVLKT